MPKLDHEQSVLERELLALALNRKRWPEVRDGFHVDLFTEASFRAVAVAILDEAEATGKAPGTIRVQNRLGTKASVVTDLLAEARQLPLVREPGELVDELERRGRSREAVRLLAGYTERLSKPGSDAVAELAELQAAIGRMVASKLPVRIESMGEVAERLGLQVAEAIRTKSDMSIPGGLVAFTRTTGGLRRKECLVICARPGGGKSSLVGHICDWAAKRRNLMSLIFSLEMASEAWVGRIVCRDAQIDSEIWREPKRWPQEIADKAAAAINALTEEGRVHLCSQRGLNVDEVCAQARAFKQRHPELAILAVDHLQLLNGPSSWRESRTREVGRVAKQLRDLSDEIDVALILLSQLNREIEKEDRAPRASDLRDSGEIEEHADVIIGLHRPNPTGDLVQLTNLKGRDIKPGTKSYARFIGPFFEFQDADLGAKPAGRPA